MEEFKIPSAYTACKWEQDKYFLYDQISEIFYFSVDEKEMTTLKCNQQYNLFKLNQDNYPNKEAPVEMSYNGVNFTAQYGDPHDLMAKVNPWCARNKFKD